MPARILVVDDQPLTRELHSEILKHIGYGALQAADGGAALAILGENEIDLLMTGINQRPPEMDGIELARVARQRDPRLKVIFVSGDTGDCLEPRDRDRLVRKPFNLDQLRHAIVDALANPDSEIKSER